MILCFNCGAGTKSSYPLCGNCLPEVLDFKKCCSLCGQPTSLFVDMCSRCLDNKPLFKGGYSFFLYRGLEKDILNQYKFKKDYRFSKLYSKLVADYVFRILKNPIICPVPTSLLKYKLKNGYQLDPIVKDFKRLGLEINWLLGKRFSKTQKRLNRLGRIKNLEGSFYLKRKPVGKNREIVLFDDVFTTGATINSCCSVLKSHGYNNIYVITLYRD